jgi:GT2 family glycosyltransferase
MTISSFAGDNLDIVLISTGARPKLLQQTISSLRRNAADYQQHTLTVVMDDPAVEHAMACADAMWDSSLAHDDSMTIITRCKRQGASASRNVGASSIPKYRRQSHVCFVDDDVYACPRWDEKLTTLANYEPLRQSILSAHSHPYNKAEGHMVNDVNRSGHWYYAVPLVISTVNMMMPWALWDDVGYFCEPGGPGGSEDYDYCMRAKAKGYGFAVTEPQCCLHTGEHSSNGNPIVGWEEVRANNRCLVELYGLKGVQFG